jgi:hypothetical protein
MTTDTKAHTNFLGIPVEGDITRPETRKAQKPLAELEPLLRAVLDDDTIVQFGWRQYTPYFNDGEECVFSAHGLWVRTVDDPAANDDDDYDTEERYEVDYGHPTLGELHRAWVGVHPNREYVVTGYTGPDQARLERCLALDKAIDSGEFDDVLLEAFGDHADIAITRSGITVDHYDHD